MNSNSYCNFFPNSCILKIKIRVPHNQSSTRLGEMPSGSRWCSTKTRPEILPTERGLLWLTMNQYQSTHGFVLNNIKASNIYSRATINFLALINLNPQVNTLSILVTWFLEDMFTLSEAGLKILLCNSVTTKGNPASTQSNTKQNQRKESTRGAGLLSLGSEPNAPEYLLTTLNVQVSRLRTVTNRCAKQGCLRACVARNKPALRT